jgi:hypothetical protein
MSGEVVEDLAPLSGVERLLIVQSVAERTLPRRNAHAGTRAL